MVIAHVKRGVKNYVILGNFEVLTVWARVHYVYNLEHVAEC